jgi:hypothetical protein
MDLDLFTIHHKEDVNIGVMQKHFTPMQVGCALSKIDLNIRRDDAFGTISHKNPNYCELTAFDDIARSSTAEHIGIMHYRRIFTEPKLIREKLANLRYRRRLLTRRIGIGTNPVERNVKVRINSLLALDTEAEKLNAFLETNLSGIDIITPLGLYYRNTTLREKYANFHIVEHFDLLMRCLVKVQPEIAPFILTQDDHPAAYYIGNMFIMRNSIFQDYWSILSSALLLVEDQINLDILDPYQSRVFGFLAERFMGIFCRYYSAKQKIVWEQLPIAFCE